MVDLRRSRRCIEDWNRGWKADGRERKDDTERRDRYGKRRLAGCGSAIQPRVQQSGESFFERRSTAQRGYLPQSRQYLLRQNSDGQERPGQTLGRHPSVNDGSAYHRHTHSITRITAVRLSASDTTSTSSPKNPLISLFMFTPSELIWRSVAARS